MLGWIIDDGAHPEPIQCRGASFSLYEDFVLEVSDGLIGDLNPRPLDQKPTALPTNLTYSPSLQCTKYKK